MQGACPGAPRRLHAARRVERRVLSNVPGSERCPTATMLPRRDARCRAGAPSGPNEGWGRLHPEPLDSGRPVAILLLHMAHRLASTTDMQMSMPSPDRGAVPARGWALAV